MTIVAPTPLRRVVAQMASALLAGWGMLLFTGIRLRAHDPGLSSMNVVVFPKEIQVTTLLAGADYLRLSLRTRSALSGDSMESGFPKPLECQVVQGPVPLEFVRFETHGNGDRECRWRWASPSAIATNDFVRLVAAWIRELPPGHRQFARVTRTDGTVIAQKLLSSDDPGIEWALDNVGPAQKLPLAGFVRLGVHHILTGYDHLLFLLVLLLVCPGVQSALALVTAFTVAHSITLIAGASGLLNIQSTWVEPLIAVSIVYAAVENLWNREMSRGRIAIVFAFGLIHGLGFASVLEEFQINSNRLSFLPLLGFNMGVEIGQVSVAALVLPLLLFLRKRRDYEPRWMPVASLLCALMGGYWLVTRIAMSWGIG